MAKRDAESPPIAPKARKDPATGLDQAFDRWLTQGLHRLFDPTMDEAIPEELLKLIEADRLAAGNKG